MAHSDGSVWIARPATPPRPQLRTPPTTPRKHPSYSSSPVGRSPRNPENASWVVEERRKAYLEHMDKWAKNHDSSTHFLGTLQIMSPETQVENLDLGKSVKCVLTDKAWSDARKHVVVRLFPPRAKNGNKTTYRLLMRSGSGWMGAREVLEKEYFANRRIAGREYRHAYDYHHRNVALAERSRLLGPKPDGKDAVMIGPLFHPFLRLPIELQQYILALAVNKTEMHQPGKNRHSGFYSYVENHNQGGVRYRRKVRSPTKFPHVLCLSKSLNSHLNPYFYRTTTFYFETQGFTSFLWSIGPDNRRQVKKITLAFGAFALLHCMRWFVPDEIFEAIGPQLGLKPLGMQYFWRCQIRDFIRELRLKMLNIDLTYVPKEDLPIIVRALRTCFADVEAIGFIYDGFAVAKGDPQLRLLSEEKSWGELCKDAFLRYQNAAHHSNMFRTEVRDMSIENFEAQLAPNKVFFEQVEPSL
ncbi:hypothetical protein K491DRAFT_717264 [Lophiostoma macrostomum CBS 122681]|uniref:Uncharacterized protein n=1 Tax=Lophiostoma macrostomum CBS 122681 TaxID=1314788 RepID=A0A6A6T705_9PLEO|nr:hypothetical protein K491DRAFT_717264 [Lophiostoma macrostomum CBS 122681]